MVKLKLLLLGFVFLSIAAGPGYSQTVSIVSGQGQVTCPVFCPQLFEPLVVVVKDASGAPMPNQTVIWSVSSQHSGTIDAGQTIVVKATDFEGKSSVLFSQPGLTGSVLQPFLQSAITATVGASSVTFHETKALLQADSAALLLSPRLTTPSVGALISGRAGQQIPEVVQVDVGAPNVSVRVEPFDPEFPSAATVACVASPGQPEGVVLSNALGIATCSLRFGSALGMGSFRVVAGNAWSWGPFSNETLVGLPCMVRTLSGDNQSANAGQALPSPLVAEVTDCGGNKLSNVPVAWTVTPQGGATLINTRTASDGTGRVSTGATLGSVANPVTIQVAVAPGTETENGQAVSATFTATANVVISQFQKLSGDLQEAAQGTQFVQALVVQVNQQGQPLPGVTVNFAVASGSGSVGATAVATDAQGRAATTVIAGQTVGPLVVTASIGTLTQQFNLTVRPPAPTNVTFENGASFQAGFISPCGIATIRGLGLAPGVQGVIVPNYFGPLPSVVANVSVRFGNVFAPIYNVANLSGQESVTVQVPCETVPGTVPVTIRVGTGTGEYTAQVRAVAPGLFESVQSDGRLRAVIVKPDGSFASVENPVRKGEIARLYATGLGPVAPAVGTNSPGIPEVESTTVHQMAVGVGIGRGVRVISSRSAPGLIGVQEVAFEVPTDVETGDLALAVAVYQGTDLVFGAPSTIPVR